MDYNEYRLRLTEIQNRYKSRMERAQLIAETISSIGKTWAATIPVIMQESVQRQQLQLQKQAQERLAYESTARIMNDLAQVRIQEKTQALQRAHLAQQLRLQQMYEFGNNVLAEYGPKVTAYLAQINDNPFAALSAYQILDHLTHTQPIVEATGANPALYNMVVNLSDYLSQLKVHDMRVPDFVQGLYGKTPEALGALKKIFMSAPVSDWDAIRGTFVSLGFGNAADEVYKDLVETNASNVGERARFALRGKIKDVLGSDDRRTDAIAYLVEKTFTIPLSEYLQSRDAQKVARYKEAIEKAYDGFLSGSENSLFELSPAFVRDARIGPSGSIYGGGVLQAERAINALNGAIQSVKDPRNKEILERMRGMLKAGGLSVHTFAELANGIRPEIVTPDTERYRLIANHELRTALLNVLATFPADVVDGYNPQDESLKTLWRSRMADYIQGVDFRDVVATLNGMPEVRELLHTAEGVYSTVPNEDRSNWHERVYNAKAVPGFRYMKSLREYGEKPTGWQLFGVYETMPQQQWRWSGGKVAGKGTIVLPSLSLELPEQKTAATMPQITANLGNLKIRFNAQNINELPQEVLQLMTSSLALPKDDRVKILRSMLQELQRLITISERDPTILPPDVQGTTRDAYRRAANELLMRTLFLLDNQEMPVNDKIDAGQQVIAKLVGELTGANVTIDKMPQEDTSPVSTYQQLLNQYGHE